MKEINDIIKDDEEDNPDDDLFWDRQEVDKWVNVMKELKGGLEKVEKDIQTIVRRQM